MTLFLIKSQRLLQMDMFAIIHAKYDDGNAQIQLRRCNFGSFTAHCWRIARSNRVSCILIHVKAVGLVLHFLPLLSSSGISASAAEGHKTLPVVSANGSEINGNVAVTLLI